MKKIITLLLLITSLTVSAQLFKEDTIYLRYYRVQITIKEVDESMHNIKVFIVKYNRQGLLAVTGTKRIRYYFTGEVNREVVDEQLFWNLQTESGVKILIHSNRKEIRFENDKSITRLYN